MAILKTDELNVNNGKKTKKKAMEYSKYFGEMDLPPAEIEERVKLAKALEIVFMYLLTLLEAETTIGNTIDEPFYTNLATELYIETLIENDIDVEGKFPVIALYVEGVVAEIVRSTIDNKTKPEIFGEDRAQYIAENETNAVRNQVLLQKAIDDGFTKKKWVTKHDARVRHTHVIADGETIGIYDAFIIGGYQMLCPKDTSLGAGDEEIVNCRCVCKYLR